MQYNCKVFNTRIKSFQEVVMLKKKLAMSFRYVPCAAILIKTAIRETIDLPSMKELVKSICQEGVIEPIIVRRIAQHSGNPGRWQKSYEKYELLVGKRRLLAARQAGCKEVPVCIAEADGIEPLILALTENIQRQDLTPIEEAKGIRALMAHQRCWSGYASDTLEDMVGHAIGKSGTFVRDRLALLELPHEVQTSMEAGKLSISKAKVISELAQPADQIKAADLAAKRPRLTTEQLREEILWDAPDAPMKKGGTVKEDVEWRNASKFLDTLGSLNHELVDRTLQCYFQQLMKITKPSYHWFVRNLIAELMLKFGLLLFKFPIDGSLDEDEKRARDKLFESYLNGKALIFYGEQAAPQYDRDALIQLATALIDYCRISEGKEENVIPIIRRGVVTPKPASVAE